MSFQVRSTNGTIILYNSAGIRMEYGTAKNLNREADNHSVVLYVSLKGKVAISNTEFAEITELGSYQHNLFYTAQAATTVITEELQHTFFIIRFTKETFLQIIKNGNEALRNFIEKVRRGEAAQLCATGIFIDIAMHAAIHSLINCTYSDELKQLFFPAKATELLVMQAHAFERSQQPVNKYIKNEYDKERILFARDYLIQHMELPPSLTELALITGINEFKLKRGFKEVFNNTVFGYLSDARLELAKNELMLQQKSASEIAFELGYSSIQHFSKAFRKKFGVSPTELK